MKKLVLVLAAFVVSAFTFTASATGYEQKAKLIILAGGVAMSGEKTLAVTMQVTDFDTLTSCNEARTLMSTPSNKSLIINGIVFKGEAFDSKLGTYGGNVTVQYRCVPAGYPMNY